MTKDKGKTAAAKFFLRIGQVGAAMPREEYSEHLFPLWLIMDAQGDLSDDAKHLTTIAPQFAAGGADTKETK